MDVCRIIANSTAQHSTAQHSTAQHSTAQHSTAVAVSFAYRELNTDIITKQRMVSVV